MTVSIGTPTGTFVNPLRQQSTLPPPQKHWLGQEGLGEWVGAAVGTPVGVLDGAWVGDGDGAVVGGVDGQVGRTETDAVMVFTRTPFTEEGVAQRASPPWLTQPLSRASISPMLDMFVQQ